MSNMDSEATRISLIKEQLIQRARQDKYSEDKREKDRRERQREIQTAPFNVDFTVRAGASNDIPIGQNSYSRRPAAQPSPPLSPIELPCSFPESHDSLSPSNVDGNAPSSPESLAGVSAFVSQTHIESPATGVERGVRAIERMQAQLDDVKVEIDEIKRLREASDRQVAALNYQLQEALRRAEETTLENSQLKGEINHLRSQLREAMAEERRLNDGMKEMITREKELLDELREAQLPQSPIPNHTSSTRATDGRSRRSDQTHRRKSSGKDDMEYVVTRRKKTTRTSSGLFWPFQK